jgi:hypothetical protein
MFTVGKIFSYQTALHAVERIFDHANWQQPCNRVFAYAWLTFIIYLKP